MNKEKLIKKIINEKYRKRHREKKLEEIFVKKESGTVKNYFSSNRKTKKIIDIYQDKRELTIYRIVDNLSRRTTTLFKKNKLPRDYTHLELIGCSYHELEEHLKKSFADGMIFDNYGEWEVDHIRPVSSFDFNDPDELLECFNYKNLQPLWKKDNRSKSNKYSSCSR